MPERTSLVLAAALALFSSSLSAQTVTTRNGVTQRVEFNFVVPDTSAETRASEYLPLEDYDRWWHEIAECEGLPLPPEYLAVRFFQVNAVHFYNRDNYRVVQDPRTGELNPQWSIAQGYLEFGVIFFAQPHRNDELPVKHELLHFLLFWGHVPPGEDGHPKPYFQRCGMTRLYLSTPNRQA